MRLAESTSNPTFPPPLTLIGANAAGSQIEDRSLMVNVWTTGSPVVIGAAVRGRSPDTPLYFDSDDQILPSNVSSAVSRQYDGVGLATWNATWFVWSTSRPRMSTSGLNVTRVPPPPLVSRSQSGASP